MSSNVAPLPRLRSSTLWHPKVASHIPWTCCPVPWQVVPSSVPLPAPVLAYNHAIILKQPQAPRRLYWASQPPVFSSNWDSSRCRLLCEPPFPQPTHCSPLPSQQKHWTSKANTGENLCFYKENHQNPSFEAYQDSPQRQKDSHSLTLSCEEPGPFIIFNIIVYLLVIAINYVRCRHSKRLPALRVPGVSQNTSLRAPPSFRGG